MQDKSKNDYYETPKERGGCLTAFLGFAILGNIFVIGLLLLSFMEYREFLDSGTQLMIYGLFAVQVGVFVSVIGLWNWKKWGYQGMIAGYVIGIIISILMGSFNTIGGSVIGLGILVYLMKDKQHLLE